MALVQHTMIIEKTKNSMTYSKNHRESAKQLLNFKGCYAPDSISGNYTRNANGTINVSNTHTITKNKSLKYVADENAK